MSARALLRPALFLGVVFTALLTAGAVLVLALLWSHLPPEARGPGSLTLAPLPLETAVVGALIALRLPRNPIGWLLCAVGLTAGVSAFANVYAPTALAWPAGRLPGAGWMALLSQTMWAPAYLLLPGLLPVIFPDGRPPSSRWRPVVWLNLLILGLVLAGMTLNDPLGSGGEGSVANPLHTHLRLVSAAADPLVTTTFVSFIGLVVLGALSLVFRWRRASGEQRQQIKWFVYAVGLLAVSVVTGLSILMIGRGNQSTVWTDVTTNLATDFVPVAIGIAILRYRLYDIDLVISRTLVFFLLAAFIGLVYVGVVAGLGHLLGSAGRPSLVLSILATALVAVAFQPLRERLQRLANRLVYGRRAEPYQVLAELSHRLAGAPSLEQVLPSLARAAAEASGAPGATAVLLMPGGKVVEASWPRSPGPEEPVHREPVTHLGELLGELRLQGREAPSGTAQRLLRVLAGQAGVLLRNLRLTAELEARLEQIRERTLELGASRQRIVAAAQSERRRLEREISEGAGRELTEIGQRLEVATGLLGSRPGAALAELERAGEEANRALEELRELARGIFPPLLADRGLAAALGAHARKQPRPVELELASELVEGRLDGRLEAAAYFCCVAALQEAWRLGAERVRLVLGVVEERELSFTVRGWGLRRTPGAEEGTEMVDRIEALNGSLRLQRVEGGLELRGRIPLPDASS